VEPEVYTRLFEYERTILSYYVLGPAHHAESLRDVVRYMNVHGTSENTWSNMEFYVTRVPSTRVRALSLPPIGQYVASSVSVLRSRTEVRDSQRYVLNVRYVNYRISPDGAYVVDGRVSTRNFCAMCDADFNVGPLSEMEGPEAGEADRREEDRREEDRREEDRREEDRRNQGEEDRMDEHQAQTKSSHIIGCFVSWGYDDTKQLIGWVIARRVTGQRTTLIIRTPSGSTIEADSSVVCPAPIKTNDTVTILGPDIDGNRSYIGRSGVVYGFIGDSRSNAIVTMADTTANRIFAQGACAPMLTVN
jgi:hypothetical protein